MPSDRWLASLNFFKRRKHSYQLFKHTQEGTTFLRDLAVFCRANETCVVPNDRDKTLVLEGRREVWLRIQNHLGLSPEELLRLYAGPEINSEA